MTWTVLVIGGLGFLGSHIVSQLTTETRLTDWDVAVLDLHEPSEKERVADVKYFVGDVRDEDRIVEVFEEVHPTVVIHTASPVHGLAQSKTRIYYEVNEMGTKNVVSACLKTGAKKLVYTSSVGVVWTGGTPLEGVCEDAVQPPKQGYDAYHHTKALGEAVVLEAGKRGELEVVVLRPCGMTGERDQQLIWRLAEVLEKKQHNIQIGDNTYLVDYCYVGNVAEAHVLAAERLLSQPGTVNGEVFFITNDDPIPVWDFNRKIWRALGDDERAKIIRIPRLLGLVLAFSAESWAAMTRTSTQFTRYSIHFLTVSQWYNIDKAKRLLGYEPRVSLDECVERTVKWWQETGAQEHAERLKSKKNL